MGSMMAEAMIISSIFLVRPTEQQARTIRFQTSKIRNFVEQKKIETDSIRIWNLILLPAKVVHRFLDVN